MKNVLISGASGNLGRAIVNESLARGYGVAALTTPRTAGMFKEVSGLQEFTANLMEESEVAQLMDQIQQKMGEVAMGVFTVGGFAQGTLEETDAGQLEKMYRLNFLTGFFLARALFAAMQQQADGGRLVFTGARPALHPEQAKEMVSYALSKSLVFRLAEILNEAGKDHGISAHVVVPGVIDTPQNREAMPGADFSKWVRPEDIAANILHLDDPSGSVLRESVLKVYGNS